MTVGLDFDGVIHSYERGWQNGQIYGTLMPGARDGIRTVMSAEAAFVFTAREDLDVVVEWIEQKLGIPAVSHADWEGEFLDGDAPAFWNEKGRLLVTNRKLPARKYLDDRGVTFGSGGWAQALADLDLDIAETVRLYIVTVSIAGVLGHDPLNKITGECQVAGQYCTDRTGKHHTFLVRSAKTLAQVRDHCREQYGHVTRVETVGEIPTV